MVTDSADIHHGQPLYMNVRDKIANWERIGASPLVLEWIQSGVYFELTHEPETFFHTQITHTEEALHYWHTKLKPHYLASGAIVQVDPPAKAD